MNNLQLHFSRIAPDYRELRITDLAPILWIKARMRSCSSGIKAADIGCGDGRYSLELFRHLGEGFFLDCVDNNRQMLKEAYGYLSKHGIKDFRIKQSLDSSLLAKDASLDCLFTFNAVQHFNLPGFLKEAERVLKEKGYLFIYTRLRSQNKRNIWGRYFPLFHQKETRLYELSELEGRLKEVHNLRIEGWKYFRYQRVASLERLIEQAQNHHYSTFSLYTEPEFEESCAQFEANLRQYSPAPNPIRWCDENILLMVRKVREGLARQQS